MNLSNLHPVFQDAIRPHVEAPHTLEALADNLESLDRAMDARLERDAATIRELTEQRDALADACFKLIQQAILDKRVDRVIFDHTMAGVRAALIKAGR